MSGMRGQLAIAAAALAAGILAWVGGYAVRYGGLKPGVAMMLVDSPALAKLAAATLHVTSSALPDGIDALAPGDRRPDLTLEDTNGHARPLSEWDGRPVLLNFWATWCAPCREEMPLLDTFQQQQGNHGVQVVGIGLDDPGKIRDWIAAHPRGFPILLAQPLGYDVTKQFGNRIGAVPFSVLIGADGRLLRRQLGAFDSLAELRDWAGPGLPSRP